MKDDFCYICGKKGVEIHHIIFKSQVRALENCKLNHIYLCPYHHRDRRNGVHFNKKLDRELKLKFQNKLEILFLKKYLTREEIKEVLKISDKPLDRLLKTVDMKNGMYERGEVIKICMGGRLYK